MYILLSCMGLLWSFHRSSSSGPLLWHVQVVRQESVKLKPGETTKDPQFVHHKAQTGAGPTHRRARRQPKVCPNVGYLLGLHYSDIGLSDLPLVSNSFQIVTL